MSIALNIIGAIVACLVVASCVAVTVPATCFMPRCRRCGRALPEAATDKPICGPCAACERSEGE